MAPASSRQVHLAIARRNLKQTGRRLAFLNVRKLPGRILAYRLNREVQLLIDPAVGDLAALTGDLPVNAGPSINLLDSQVLAGRTFIPAQGLLGSLKGLMLSVFPAYASSPPGRL